jgi:SSS family solute:Na+ symporter
MLAFAVAGTNQQSVQRYVSCATARDAQKAAVLGWATGFIGVAATLLLGVVFYGYYALRPGLLPEDTAPDQILPTFIAHELPVGVAGLLVAAVFAAAMSSIDSALHSLSTTMVVDFYRRLVRPQQTEAHYLRFAQAMILLWGVVGIGAAFYVAETGESLLPFLAKYTSYFIGPVLGMFVLAVLVPFSSGHGAFFGALLSVGGLVAMVQWTSWSVPGIWFSAITAPGTVVLGALISLLSASRRTAA